MLLFSLSFKKRIKDILSLQKTEKIVQRRAGRRGIVVTTGNLSKLYASVLVSAMYGHEQ